MPSDPFDVSVFINCPFDDAYRPNFRATVFAVLACGFTPRCALEVVDAGEVRIDIIARIVETCRLGIHDISRTELDRATSLPRFNMPFELGFFLGCKRFGGDAQRTKSCIIFDIEKYRYQRFISDIAGQDIFGHDNDPRVLIGRVRDWRAAQRQGEPLPGGKAIADVYDTFAENLPVICDRLQLEADELTFDDLVYVMREDLMA